ncbi:MAG: lysylphosphatidylglycerol synthase transmembrane domain-containing protein [Candidatus Firestonebacteria bacterium]
MDKIGSFANQNKRIKFLRFIRFIIPPIISVIILIVIFSKINFYEVLGVIKKINLNYLSLAFLISLIGTFFIPADKWRRILAALGYNLSYKKALFIKIGTAPTDVILPFKMGEMLKAMYLKKYYNFTIGKVLSSIIFDKTLNLWAVLILFFTYASFIHVPTSLKIFSFIFVFLSILLLKKRIWSFLHLITEKIHLPLHNFIKHLTSAFEEINIKYNFFLLCYSVLDMLSEIIIFYILFKALGLNIPFNFVVPYAALVVLISSIPIVAMGIGLREASVLLLFSQFATTEVLLSIGILVSLISHFLLRLIGLFILPNFLARLFNSHNE